jgi:hypothetical protein
MAIAATTTSLINRFIPFPLREKTPMTPVEVRDLTATPRP